MIAERDSESETDKILQARGYAHEAEHLARLRTEGREIIDVSAAISACDRFGWMTTSLISILKMKQVTFYTFNQQARLQLESKGLLQPKFEVINPKLAGLGMVLQPSLLDVYSRAFRGFLMVAKD